MRFNSKKLRKLSKLEHHNKPMQLGEISPSGKLHVYLGRHAQTYRDMLKMYIRDYDTVAKADKLMSLDTAKKLYRGSQHGKDLWLTPDVASGLLGAGSHYVNSFKLPQERPYHFYHMIILAHNELKPIKMTRKQLHIFLINNGNTISVIAKKYPGTPVFFDLRKTLEIYNRFHKDKVNINDRYVVLTIAVGRLTPKSFSKPSPGKDVQFYYCYDDNGERHRATLASIVNNPTWQMDKTTAQGVVKNIKKKADEETPAGKVGAKVAFKFSLAASVMPYRINEQLIEKSRHDTAGNRLWPRD